MLPVAWLVVAVVAAVLLSMWVTFTVTRLDRLHARVDAARAALDAELVRRAAALLEAARAAQSGLPPESRAAYERVAHEALAVQWHAGRPGDPAGTGRPGEAATAGRPGGDARREPAENAVGRAVAELALGGGDTALVEELREAAARVQVARRFYNDAVRDTRALRARRLPRLLRLAGHVPTPPFFDIDDTVPAIPAAPARPPAPRPAPVPDQLPFPYPAGAESRRG